MSEQDRKKMVDRAARLLMVLPDDKTSFICGFIGKVARKQGDKLGVDYFTQADVERWTAHD